MTDKKRFASIDEYIAAFPGDVQAVLQELRRLIRQVSPEAAEAISYEIPTFRLNGKNVVHFAGWKSHVSLYPIPAGTEAFRERLAPYVAGKGTLRFPLGKPLPSKLVEETVRLLVEESASGR
jgi:uncharacterized protein YdhG (YjbR/CyaY superfamily)